MDSNSENRELNEELFKALSTPHLEKEAAAAMNEFTRVREEPFHKRILPPLQITNDDLDRCIDTDKPVKMIDSEKEEFLKHPCCDHCKAHVEKSQKES